MDGIDRTIFRVFRDATDRRTITRYGAVRFRRRVRRHLEALERAIIQIYDHEPVKTRDAMICLSLVWESDEHTSKRETPVS